ncbi:MAG TPA: hypothetical protein VHR66_18505 [Gemmataceae bacterium]|nr:hypothetical protein [Gemmataceae bacterium]
MSRIDGSCPIPSSRVLMAAHARHGHVQIGERGAVDVLGLCFFHHGFRGPLEAVGVQLILGSLKGLAELGLLADPEQFFGALLNFGRIVNASPSRRVWASFNFATINGSDSRFFLSWDEDGIASNGSSRAT